MLPHGFGQERGPLLHERPPPLEQVRPPVGRLDGVRVHARQRQLAHLPRGVRALRGRVPEARTEPVRHRPDPQVPDHLRDRHFGERPATRRREHQLRATARGTTRVEISVPLRDAPLLRSLAQTLREEGARATGLRQLLETEVVRAPAATGVELVDFLLASPLREVELELERDRSSGRPVDFE